MEIKIGATDRAGFIGMTGTGKTYRMWQMMTPIRRFAVLDAKHSPAFELPGFPINRKFEDRDEKQIIRVPITDHEEDDWDRVMRAVWGRGRMTLVIDEMTLINEQRRIRAALGACIRTGRERGLQVFWGSQRPRDIPRAALTECDHLFVFMLSDEDDRKRIAGFIGKEAAALIPEGKDATSGGDCLYFHIPSRQHCIIPRTLDLGPGPSPPPKQSSVQKMDPHKFRERGR
jgi:hypothetical protein